MKAETRLPVNQDGIVSTKQAHDVIHSGWPILKPPQTKLPQTASNSTVHSTWKWYFENREFRFKTASCANHAQQSKGARVEMVTKEAKKRPIISQHHRQKQGQARQNANSGEHNQKMKNTSQSNVPQRKAHLLSCAPHNNETVVLCLQQRFKKLG